MKKIIFILTFLFLATSNAFSQHFHVPTTSQIQDIILSLILLGGSFLALFFAIALPFIHVYFVKKDLRKLEEEFMEYEIQQEAPITPLASDVLTEKEKHQVQLKNII